MRHIMFYVFSTRSINPYLYRNKADFIMSIGTCFCSGILNFVWMHITWDKYGCWSVLRVVVLKPVFSCACWENGCVFLKEVRFSIFWSFYSPIASLLKLSDILLVTFIFIWKFRSIVFLTLRPFTILMFDSDLYFPFFVSITRMWSDNKKGLRKI